MNSTKFMERLFSAVNEEDAQLVNQVDGDIKAAERDGKFEDDEVSYVALGEGKVLVTDKVNNEQTVVEREDEENYYMYPAEQSQQIEGFAHPEGDGVTPGQQSGAADEHVEEHMTGEDVISPNQPDGGLNPEAGHEISVEETAAEGPEPADEDEDAEDVCPECGKNPCECEESEEEDENEEEREFSNSAVARIVMDQVFCERLFSEVIESEDTAKVGDLKIEKIDGEDAVIVTDESTGDQARVEIDGDELDVTELDSKNFSEDEEYEEEASDEVSPIYVVGADTINHQLVDATEFDAEGAQELVERLQENGVDAVNVFDDPEAARDYATELLGQLGCESEEDVEEPEECMFSDHTVYVTRYFSDHSVLMDRLFSEACDSDECPSCDEVEDAIESGEEIEVDNAIITPVDSKTAVIEDKENGEFTKATLSGEDVEFEHISEDEASDLVKDLQVEDNDEDLEKKFSEVASNAEQTKFFSIHEEMTSYMERLFSEDADEAEIEDAIESGEEIENDTEIITPVDSKTAVIEDKENGEFTKAVMDDEKLDVTPISEEEAKELVEDLVVEHDTEEEGADDEDEEESEEEENEEEKRYSMNLNVMDKFFAEAGIAVPVAEEAGPELAPGHRLVEIDEEGNIVADPEAEAAMAAEEEAAAQEVPSVEAIEDKALAAVNSIQAAAAEASAQILQAKAAPAQAAEPELKEATFSEKNGNEMNNTLTSWLKGVRK